MEDPCYKSEPYVVICAKRKGGMRIDECIALMISRDGFAGFKKTSIYISGGMIIMDYEN
jgi:hypothetical protein